MREVGLFLAENSPKANNNIYERFRAVLHEGAISKRCQYMIEVLFQVRKDKYKDNPTITPGLDLVEEEEQITHKILLDDELQMQETLSQSTGMPFADDRYLQGGPEISGQRGALRGYQKGNTRRLRRRRIRKRRVGFRFRLRRSPRKGWNHRHDGNQLDQSTTNHIFDHHEFRASCRRVPELMCQLNFEEAVHKLMKINIPEGREASPCCYPCRDETDEQIELCNMIIECCSQERSYNTFYGLIGERFCKLNRIWTDCFQEAFMKYYDTIHRYETNKLRNIGRFFGHVLATDGISWAVLHVVHMNEEETTSSSRIFVKIMLQEMLEVMGINTLAERFKTPDLRPAFRGLFPMDNPKNTRFAINYYTSIGLGRITEEMRNYLQNAPKLMAAQHAALRANDSSDSDSSDLSSSSSDSSDSSSSESERNYTRRRRTSSPPRRRRYSSDSNHSRDRRDHVRNKGRSPRREVRR